MNGQFQPKYVGTFRKVDAGMVIAAGKPFLFFSLSCIQLNERRLHAYKFPLLIQYFPPLGISMFSNLKMTQLFQVEEVQYLLSPPLVWLALHLTEEGQGLLFCRLRWYPGRNAADQSLWTISQILNTTLGIWQQILLRNSHKVIDVFMGETDFGQHFSTLD